MMIRARTILALAAAAAVAAAVLGGAFVYSGIYDVSAKREHTAPVYFLVHAAMVRAVQVRAASIQVPPLSDPAMRRCGEILFTQHCVQCHGGPGVAPREFALGLRPEATNLAAVGRDWTPAEIYWVIDNGIKMTAMPAWERHLSPHEMWSITAFVKQLPEISPADFRKAAQTASLTAAPPPCIAGGG